MEQNQLFQKDKFYIIRAEKAGVFMAKIDSIDGDKIAIRAARRLYYWKGALDVTHIAKFGVSNPRQCKFPAQLDDSDISVVNNLVEFHPATEQAISSINSVEAWKS